MNTFSAMKKRLLVLALSMAMAVCFVSGVVFMDAGAQTTSISDLVTVSGDGQVMTEPQQYTLKNNGNDGTVAGTKVGDTGLYVQATQADSAQGFTVALNGIFQGSTGMYVSFPGEGFWDGSYREAIMTVASISDPSEQFQLHLDDVWGMYAYVTFEYEGQTLTRSRSKYNGPDYNAETGAETLDYLYYKNTGDYFFPVMGAFQDGGSTADPRRTACYFGLEMLEDGTLNVILTVNTDWAAPYKKVIASFAEDPATFEPITSGQGATPNLPKLESFRDGYTVRFQVRDQANNKACDFLLKSVATSATGDPYKNGTTVTLDQASLAETPQFYALWAETPVVSVAEYDKAAIDPSPVNREISLPAATYTTTISPDPQPVTDIFYRVGTEEWVKLEGIDATAPKITPTQAGTYTIRYSATAGVQTASQDITFTVRDDIVFEEIESAQILSVSSNATITANTQYNDSGERGILVQAQDPQSEDSYTVDMVGVFNGNTTLRWNSPGTTIEVDGLLIFTVAELGNPSNAFKVVWGGAWQSYAYVEYNWVDAEGETQILRRASDEWDSGKYYYREYTNEQGNLEGIGHNGSSQFLPFTGSSDGYVGVLKLEWQGDVLNVIAVNGKNGMEQVMASFDTDPAAFTPSTENFGATSNLPKISFANGYTISVDLESELNWMLFDVTTGGMETSLDADTLRFEPVFYTQGKQIPIFGAVEQIADVKIGTEVPVPSLTYTTHANAEPQPVTDIQWGPKGGNMTAVENGIITPNGADGDYVVRYTVSALGVAFVKEVTFHACTYTELKETLVPATCTETGTGLYACVHGNVVEAELPMLGHEYKVVWKWNQSCSIAYATFICVRGDDVQTITATPEDGIVEIEERYVAPTCTTQGLRAWKATVTFQGEIFTNETSRVVAPLGHDYGYQVKWTWAEDLSSATATCVCTREGCGQTETVTAEVVSEVIVAPTCHSEGITKYTAKINRNDRTYTDTKTAKTGMTAHVYGEPTWEWENFDKATATFVCTNEGCANVQTAEATAGNGIASAVTKEPTCIAEGEKTYTAKVTVGGKVYTDTKTEVLAKTTHNIQAVAAKPSTCTESGNVAYFACKDCQKYFADAAGTKEITDKDSVKLEPVGHKLTKTEGKEATCTEDGNIAYWTCANCGKYFADENGNKEVAATEIGIAAHHTLEAVAEVPATCVEEGTQAHYKCTVCGKLFFDQNAQNEVKDVSELAIEKTGHELEKVEAKAPTCTEPGNATYYQCKHCGKIWSDEQMANATDLEQVTLAATGHKYGDDGKCTVCGAEDPEYVEEGGCSGAVSAYTAIGGAVLLATATVALICSRKKREKE